MREGCLALMVQGMGDFRLPDPGKDWQLKGWKDGLRGLGRDGPILWVPDILLAEFFPAEVWRNSAQR